MVVEDILWAFFTKNVQLNKFVAAFVVSFEKLLTKCQKVSERKSPRGLEFYTLKGASPSLFIMKGQKGKHTLEIREESVFGGWHDLHAAAAAVVGSKWVPVTNVAASLKSHYRKNAVNYDSCQQH